MCSEQTTHWTLKQPLSPSPSLSPHFLTIIFINYSALYNNAQVLLYNFPLTSSLALHHRLLITRSTDLLFVHYFVNIDLYRSRYRTFTPYYLLFRKKTA